MRSYQKAGQSPKISILSTEISSSRAAFSIGEETQPKKSARRMENSARWLALLINQPTVNKRQ
jgi:hypothetical protein